MICPYCGNAVEDDAVRCTVCGEKVSFAGMNYKPKSTPLHKETPEQPSNRTENNANHNGRIKDLEEDNAALIGRIKKLESDVAQLKKLNKGMEDTLREKRILLNILMLGIALAIVLSIFIPAISGAVMRKKLNRISDEISQLRTEKAVTDVFVETPAVNELPPATPAITPTPVPAATPTPDPIPATEPAEQEKENFSFFDWIIDRIIGGQDRKGKDLPEQEKQVVPEPEQPTNEIPQSS